MKKLIVFDLDGTLAESKSSLDTEKVMQQSRHFGIKRRFTLGKCTVQIKND